LEKIMRKTVFILIIAVMVLFVVPLNAEQPNVESIMTRALDAVTGRALSQKMMIIVKDKDKITSQMTAGVARKRISDGDRSIRSIIVLLEPAEVRGTAYLFSFSGGSTFDQWIYFPYIGRVKKVVGAGAFESFLGTDFRLSDLVGLQLQGAQKLIGEETISGVPVYKIETIPPKKEGALYSRIINWIAKDTYYPIRQDYYDLSGNLWKRQQYDEITIVNKLAVPTVIRMSDLKDGTSTELKMTEINTGEQLLNDKMFMPEQLMHSLECPVWERVCYPVKK
jgi:hypothetical protein